METTKKPTPPSDDIDLMRYVSLFISNWIWIAAALFIALGMAYIFNRYSQRVYNVKSTLLIKEQQNTGAIPNMEQIFAGNIYNPYPNLDDEVAITKIVYAQLPRHRRDARTSGGLRTSFTSRVFRANGRICHHLSL